MNEFYSNASRVCVCVDFLGWVVIVFLSAFDHIQIVLSVYTIFRVQGACNIVLMQYRSADLKSIKFVPMQSTLSFGFISGPFSKSPAG